MIIGFIITSPKVKEEHMNIIRQRPVKNWGHLDNACV